MATSVAATEIAYNHLVDLLNFINMKNDEVAKLVNQLTICIKELRLKQGLSHDSLAEKSGLTRQSVSMIESGRRVPSIASCLKIANGLGLSLQKLLDAAESSKSRKNT